MKFALTQFAARRPRHVTALFMLALPAFLFVQEVSAQGRPAGVVVEVVETRSFTETAPVLGEFVAPTSSVVASRIPGLIADISVRVGDRVEEGDLLIKLDTELLDIELRAAQASRTEAEAGLTVAEADLALAQQAFERVERLKSSPAFSQGQFNDLGRQLQRAQGQIAQANARIRSADVAIARSQYNLQNAEIKAPFSGTVLERQAQLGEYINTGNAVVTLLDQANLEIVADVPYAYVGGLSDGREITVRLSSGTEYKASIRALLPRETVSTRTRPVRLSAPFTQNDAVDGATPFAVGQSVTVQVPVSEERKVLTVPKDALVQARGGWIVYIAEDGKAQPRPVEIGAAVGNRFEVLGGLQEGWQVVVRGNERLRPGQDIMTGPPGGGSNAPAATTEGAPKDAAKAQETDGKPDNSKSGG
ncbi:MAG: efflux RND transporter periplasmic adaptor subunit [Hyphomicrobiales bacterium]